MTDERCAFEPNVVAAAESGEWTEALRGHAASCADCAAAGEAASWMHAFARIDEREHMLPDPAVLWLKAKLLGSSAAVDRVSLPMNRMQIAVNLILAAAWAALLTWKWGALQAWMTALTPGHLIATSAGTAASASLSLSFLMTLLCLGAITIAVGLHSVLAEE
jgi:hypothetical protein